MEISMLLKLNTAVISILWLTSNSISGQNNKITVNEKLNKSVQSYMATYLGGTGREECYSIALDDEDIVYRVYRVTH